MTTLGKLSTIIIRTLSGGNQANESKVDRRVVVSQIRTALNGLLKRDYYDRKNQDGDRFPSDMYIATYEVDIDEKGDGILPDTYVSLPFGGGVLEAHPLGKKALQFIKKTNSSVTSVLLERMDKDGDGTEMQTYTVEGLNVAITYKKYFGKKMIFKVMKAAPDTIGLNDPLPISPEHEIEVAQAVIGAMGPTVQVPTDNLSDNNPNTTGE